MVLSISILHWSTAQLFLSESRHPHPRDSEFSKPVNLYMVGLVEIKSETTKISWHLRELYEEQESVLKKKEE